MATTDLSNYDLSELKKLQQDIEKAIKDRQQQDVKKAREQILAISQDLGVSIEELLGNTAKQTRAGKGVKAQAQYRNPDNDAQTWSGRGRQPRWIVDGLANGKTLEDFRL